MNKNLKRLILLSQVSILFLQSSFAQSTLEWTKDGSDNNTLGPSTNPIVVTFLKDALNAPFSTVFSPFSPALTATVSFRNQQKSTVLNGSSTVVPGLTFGGRNTESNGGASVVQSIASAQVYNVFGANIPSELPKNTMYLSSPSATPMSKTDSEGYATGPTPTPNTFDTELITGATGPSGSDANFGVSIYSTVEPLYDANEPKDGRFYYGDLVITFNRPVVNPVIHVGGLGGSYNYEPLGGGPRQISYFTTELELNNTGLTSTLMAGNENINLVGDYILNSSATPNAGSYDGGTTSFGFADYGAASGSVRLNGTVQEIVYRVYVRGSSASNFNFSKSKADINSATRDPMNGDFWYLSISLDKPTQEISGTVYIDPDALVDNNINKNGALANVPTNVGGQLYAILLNNAGKDVATTAVGSDGSYLFTNVPLLGAGSYSVIISTINGIGSYAFPATAPPALLPDGWINTGENISSVTQTGSDGFANGKLVVPALTSDTALVKNNFGIERVPESQLFSTMIKIPSNGSILTLSSLSLDSLGAPMPALSGSDPEDQPITLPLTGKVVKITSLPTNIGATTTLLYGGLPVVLNQIITNFNPDLLQIRFNTVTFAPLEFLGSTTFGYAYVDAAGVADPTPTTYTVYWQRPVPIVLEEFAVSKANCVATLKWKTTGEINFDRFEVELSTITNDRFTKIGTVLGKGNSNTVSNYQLLYPMESEVIYYFRLKMIDKDGHYSYSSIQSLTCLEKQEITIKPNPTVDNFKISNMEKGKNVVTIFSQDGRLIETYNFSSTSADISIKSYAAGVYIVRIQNENGSNDVKRIVKQ